MPPRECDNDDCDYETYVDDDGQPQVKWVHVDPCEGPVELPPLPHPEDVRPGSFLAYLMGK